MSQGIGKFEVGFHSWSFASLSLEEALMHIKDVGFAEVEINADRLHLDPRLFPRCRLPRLNKLLEDLSLHPSSVHAPINGVDLSTPDPNSRKQTIDLLKDTLEYSTAIECPMVVVHPNHSNSLFIGSLALRKNSVEVLKELVNKAEDLGVKVALENVIDRGGGRFGSRVIDLREIIEDVGSHYLGICFDTGHANLLTDPDVSQEEEMVKAGEYLWTLHIHDNDGKEDRHWPPGDGNIEWSQVIRGLRRVNYRGVFMMEVAEVGNTDELAHRCLQRGMEIVSIQ